MGSIIIPSTLLYACFILLMFYVLFILLKSNVYIYLPARPVQHASRHRVGGGGAGGGFGLYGTHRYLIGWISQQKRTLSI